MTRSDSGGLVPRGPALAAYCLAATLAAPVLRLALRRRAGRGREVAERLHERRGVELEPRPDGALLWLHAASVGETASLLPVIAALPAALGVLLTTGTVASASLARQRLDGLGRPGVRHRFAPLDVPGWVGRFLDQWQPDAVAFVESELWPATIAACRRRAIPMALLNARMSERSLRGWSRAPGLAAMLLGAFARVEAQSEQDAARLHSLGAPLVTAPGNLKFAAGDLPVDQDELARLRARLDGRPAWLAASTHAGEEEIALAVHRRLAASHPGLVTLIAPRHPVRAGELASRLGGVPRRACGQDLPPGGVWLADTLGELGLLYHLCGTAFVGNSLVTPGGGHNPLEAAWAGCAVAVGPQTASFAAVVDTLRGAGALAQVGNADALAVWVDAMLRDSPARQAMGAAGREVAQAHAGLPAEVAARLVAMMDGADGSASHVAARR